MNDPTNKTKLEVLKMARELLNEEYINRRAEDHNRWIAECDVAWKTKGIKLAYPPFAPYPSEAEILAKASTLYKFVVEKEMLAPPTVATAIDPAGVSPWVTHLAPTPDIVPISEAAITTLLEKELPPPTEVIQEVPLTVKEDPIAESIPSKPLFATAPSTIPTPSSTTTIKSLLPNWLQSKDTNV